MRRQILSSQFFTCTVIAAFLVSGCATSATTEQLKVSTSKQTKDTKLEKSQLTIPFSGFTTKNIIRNGEPKGPQTMVLQGFSGEILMPQSELSRSAEGRPGSGTIAIVDPATTSDDFVFISLDSAALVRSQFEGKKLVVEADARNMSMLLGEGATYLIRPGIEKIRLGDFWVSTSDAKDWCSIEMTGPSRQPKLSGTGIKILQDLPK
jgi:hypothetical protein